MTDERIRYLKHLASTIRGIADRVQEGKFDHWRLESMFESLALPKGATLEDLQAGDVELHTAYSDVVTVELPMQALNYGL